MNLRNVSPEILHKAIRELLNGHPTYINCNGAISTEKDDDCLTIEKTNNETTIKDKDGKECFSEIAQLYGITAIQNVSKDRGNEQSEFADIERVAESIGAIDSVESNPKRKRS